MSISTMTPLRQAFVDAKVATARAMSVYKNEQYGGNPVRIAAALAAWHARLEEQKAAAEALRAHEEVTQDLMDELSIAAARMLGS